MLYTPLTKRALRLCFEAHAFQVDKCGIPYANHPLHLAEQMTTEDEVCVALLHDVMEDCGRTPDDLRAIGLSERALEALVLLTHEPGVPYGDYVCRLRSNAIARKVKIADLRHNSELARLDVVRGKDLVRLRKYMDARVALGDMAYELPTPAGPLRVEVGGEPYPFVVRDETRAAWTYHEEDVRDAAQRGGKPAMGCPEATYCIEVETLPLAVGERVAIVVDAGDKLVDWGSGEGISYEVYAKDGHTIGLGYREDETDFNGTSCAYRHDGHGVYRIVEDPVEHRFYDVAHKLGVCIAWRKGTSEADAVLVGWVAGL